MNDEPTCEIQSDGQEVFVIVNGVTIAKRGNRGPAKYGTWIMLEPGWVVRDITQGEAIEIRFEGASIH
jgi:hypothetical protein